MRGETRIIRVLDSAPAAQPRQWRAPAAVVVIMTATPGGAVVAVPDRPPQSFRVDSALAAHTATPAPRAEMASMLAALVADPLIGPLLGAGLAITIVLGLRRRRRGH